VVDAFKSHDLMHLPQLALHAVELKLSRSGRIAETRSPTTCAHEQGDFKIAHCGGFHSFLNLFIKAVNLVAKLLHHNIRWDTETIGCDPRYAGIAKDMLSRRAAVSLPPGAPVWA